MSAAETMDLLEGEADRLAELLAVVDPDRDRERPTPCADFDVAALTAHLVGWFENFAAGFENDGECPRADIDALEVAAREAPSRFRSAVAAMRVAIDRGAGERPLAIGGQGVPGDVALSMILGEAVIHGWDLARALGRDWHPDAHAVDEVDRLYRGMLADPAARSGMFAAEVEPPADADHLDRLIAFTGRDPAWHPRGR